MGVPAQHRASGPSWVGPARDVLVVFVVVVVVVFVVVVVARQVWSGALVTIFRDGAVFHDARSRGLGTTSSSIDGARSPSLLLPGSRHVVRKSRQEVFGSLRPPGAVFGTLGR